MDTSTAGEGQRGADLKETAKHVKHEDVGTSRWQFGASDAGAGGSASENGAGGDLMDMEPADGMYADAVWLNYARFLQPRGTCAGACICNGCC